MALVGVSALAALTSTEPPKPKIDHHFEAVINSKE
jgi:hypothetical protein